MHWTIPASLVAGLALLVIGADVLVRGASRLALIAGISPLVVGLTVVAFGTSAPELAVSVKAALDGRPALAVGNVVGSNIFNVLFVLGICALLTPLSVSRQLVRRDVPLMVCVSVAFALMVLDGALGLADGVILVAGLVAYTVHAIRESRRERGAIPESDVAAPPAGGVFVWARSLAFVVAGLALLVTGAQWLVGGAVALAVMLGIDEVVVGLTVVAAGTSLPEVATSIVASVKGERDLAVGNVVGSSLYNLLAIAGLTAVIAPGGLAVPDHVLAFDLWMMLAVSVACLPIFFTGYTIARWEGAVFFGYYIAYTTLVVLSSTDSAYALTLGRALTWFALPLTGLTLLVIAWRAWRADRRDRARAHAG